MAKIDMIGKTFCHSIYGEYVVLDSYEKRNKAIFYEVEFKNTGYKTFARADRIRDLMVKDKKYCKENIIGKTFINSKEQEYKVVSLSDSDVYLVEFLKTGTIIKKSKRDIVRNCVYDIKGETKSTIYNPTTGKREKRRSYYLHSAMIQRQKTRGSLVCEEWKEYEGFMEWLVNEELKRLNVSLDEFELKEKLVDYELDKDLIGKSNIYSPDTCRLIKKDLNSALRNLSNSKVILKKDNKKIVVKNVLEFLESLGYEIVE